jgi:integrase
LTERFEVIQGGLTGDVDVDYLTTVHRALGPLVERDSWNVSAPFFRTHFSIPNESALWSGQYELDLQKGREMEAYELEFGDIREPLRSEAKLYFALRLSDPRKRTIDWFHRAKNLVGWFVAFDIYHPGKLLRELEQDELRDGFEAFLRDRGSKRKPLKQSRVRNGELITTEYRDGSSMPANDVYYVLRLFRETAKPLDQRDWILAEHLGFTDLKSRARADNLLKLDRFTASWFRDAVRSYLIFKSTDRQFSWPTIGRIVPVIDTFYTFLTERFGNPRPEDITKKLVVEDFKGWGVRDKKLAGYQWFSDVCVFLHAAMDRDVPGLPKFVVTPDHFPRARKSTRQYHAEAPERAISAEVLAAIIDHIHELPVWVRRVFILGRYTAYRRTDLHSCPYHLLQPDDGTFMQLVRYHSKTDSTSRQLVKIDDEIGELIIKTVTDQQIEVKKEYGFIPDFLFPSPRTGDAKPTHRAPETSAELINKLLVRHKVVDPKTGEQASFNWHSLRHHRGNELALQGFDIIFIQTELGHSTPNMTMQYITARNDLKKKVVAEKGSGFLINIQGDIVVPRTTPDHELRKQQIRATWTNGGSCGLPGQIGEWCDHANACLGCNHYNADSESVGYFEVQETKLSVIVQDQEGMVAQYEDQGSARLAQIERNRLERNRKALSGCQNILKTIREHGRYKGEASKYRKATD